MLGMLLGNRMLLLDWMLRRRVRHNARGKRIRRGNRRTLSVNNMRRRPSKWR